MKEKCFVADEQLEISNLSIVFVTHEHGTVVEFPKGRYNECLLFTTKGEIRYEDSNNTYSFDACEGDLTYFPTGEVNRAFYVGDDNEVMGIRFHTDGHLYDRPCIFEAGSNDRAYALLWRLNEDLKTHKITDNAYFYHAVYEIIYHLNRQKQDEVPGKFHKLFAVIAELQSEPEKNCKVRHYAEVCGMSEVGFRKLFMECTGKSPVEYRTHVRLRKANDMLASGEYSITEVAEKCGFNSVSFFCREYKKFYGYNAGSAHKIRRKQK